VSRDCEAGELGRALQQVHRHRGVDGLVGVEGELRQVGCRRGGENGRDRDRSRGEEE